MEVQIKNRNINQNGYHCFIIENNKIISFYNSQNPTKEIHINDIKNNINDIIALLYIGFTSVQLHPDSHNITCEEFSKMLAEIVLPKFNINFDNHHHRLDQTRIQDIINMIMINSVKFGAINLQDYNTTSYNKYYHLDINKHTLHICPNSSIGLDISCTVKK